VPIDNGGERCVTETRVKLAQSTRGERREKVGRGRENLAVLGPIGGSGKATERCYDDACGTHPQRHMPTAPPPILPRSGPWPAET
jgi:hypothetical protein